MLTDYHIHPNYSIDAGDFSIDAYCQKAVSLEIDEICFTTHLELDPILLSTEGFVKIKNKLIPVTDNWFNKYKKEIDIAKLKYKNKLKVFCGLEVGYEPEYENVINENLKKYKLDFVLGAVHTIEHFFIDTQKDTPVSLGKRTFKEMSEIYFKYILKAIESKLFCAIAHFDLYKWYGLKYYGKQTFKIYPDLVSKCFYSMATNNIALEINAGSYRHGFDQPYPSLKLLELAKECKIKYITTGSDCHKLEYLGYKIKELKAIARKFEFKILTI